VANQFRQQAGNPEISVSVSGTSGGFKRFCAGQTKINNASRPIKTAELEACRKAGVPFIELPIAFDALTVVVNPQNTWAKDITTAELKQIWEPAAQGKITSWRQVRPSYPDKPLVLVGPDAESGTFDYFTEVINGDPDASRKDYTASEDDDTLVRNITKNPNALGYFGYAYFEQNQNQIRALPVDAGKGAVSPSPQTVEQAKYQPLSRPLFIYVNIQAAQSNKTLRDFVAFYLQNANQTVKQVGYIPLPAEAYRVNQIHFTAGKVGKDF
jgi:phosphate transport system substrate-binding protein